MTYLIKGHVLYSKTARELLVKENAYLLCEEGKLAGLFEQLPEKYENLPLEDYGDSLIIPGLSDIHLHAPQYSFRGLRMDLELLDWLNTNSFPEEGKYGDMAYAREAYSIFVEALRKSPTTRASIFATLHKDSSLLLMDLLEESGLKTWVGKVNMDRNSPDYLMEKSARQALEDSEAWLQESFKSYQNCKAILTPRFTPSCSDKLMEGLGALKKKYSLPLQSHLSENQSEIDWVKALCPDCETYTQTYARFGLLEGAAPTVMAHCVYLEAQEQEMLRKSACFVAHCPQSNINLSSGIAPIRKYMEQGLKVGLGTDIAGGHSLSMFRAITDAIQVSKLYWRLLDQRCEPLRFSEAFYLATKGGGELFGKVGSFEEGYEFDALVLNEDGLKTTLNLNPEERLERFVYLAGDSAALQAKYVAGKKLFGKA